MIVILTVEPVTNWTAISALSNIGVALATFLAVIVSLWIATSGNKPKIKIVMNETKYEECSFRLVNKGIVPVVILKKGFVTVEPFWRRKEKKVIEKKNGNWLLGQSEHDNALINNYRMTKILIGLGNRPGEKVKLKVMFVDSREKVYSKIFIFKVFDPDEEEKEIKLTLNESIKDKIS